MRLQYYYSKGGFRPQDGAGTLRMLQFLHTWSAKARPHVPEKFLLFTHVVPNNLVVTLGVLPLLAGMPLIQGMP